MASIKRDDNKQSWESSDTEFPLVCETCLGDNPYVRMTKEPHGKKCQICENPFTVFAWQAGTKGRLKRVEICRSCAEAKNVCQVCIYDLRYGLPVKVRDKVLREAGSSSSALSMPQSNANRSWYNTQQQRALEQGQGNTDDVTAYAHAKLTEMARMQPQYERNLAKLCSFFARGECDRGANCPFRHEMPRDRNDPMSKQNTKDRFFGTSDPVANKILGRKRRFEETKAKDQQTDGFEKAFATVFVRFRGDAPYPVVSESEVRDQFYSFGEISGIRIQRDAGHLFVEYTQPEAADFAIASMNKKYLLGRDIFVDWARATKRGENKNGHDANSKLDTSSQASTFVVKPVAQAINASKLNLPSGFTAKPSPQVAALVTARFQSSREGSDQKPIVSIAHQDGISKVDDINNRPSKKNHTSGPHYPSSDVNRLGS